MAGDWIKMRTDLHDDPEVLRLSSMLKLDRFSVVGRLAVLWAWADKHTTDGTATVTPLLLDDLVSHHGFSDAMTVVGWLEVSDRGVRFPKFNRHNGKSAKKRALTARRVAGHKKRKGNAEVTLVALPREEKRREEKNNNTAGFARFWLAWPASPRKVARAECGKRWLRHGLEANAEAIVAHVEASKRSEQWQRGFEPAPLTYLNQRRWEDGDSPRPDPFAGAV